MERNGSLASRVAFFATVLAFVVVMLGAYTRLTDSGLGCPDWPGCYGHVMVPDTHAEIQQASAAFPAQPVHAGRAWREMIHRYAAGTLGLIIFGFALAAIRRRHAAHFPKALPVMLAVLVVFQAALGMWTVTWQLLPMVVMGHLLGGMAILALLWCLYLRLGGFFKELNTAQVKSYRPWVMFGLFIVTIQIALGGWVSSNYAALVCPTFPLCMGHLLPPMDFHSAFNLFSPIGINYDGGVLGNTARVTIQMVHRYGALVTALYMGGLGVWIAVSSRHKNLKRISIVMLLALVLQIALGVLNIEWLLPLPVAVMHNGVATLLLLSIVTLLVAVFSWNELGARG